MNRPNLFIAATVAVAVAGGTFAVARLAGGQGPSRPELVTEPGSVRELLYARPFRLEEPYTNYWRAERSIVTTGYLVVIEADPARLVPRQLAEPVLYFGDQTAERINHGYPSGRVVALVPRPENADGLPEGDLASMLIWLGNPELPERVDAATIEAELAEARARGAQPTAPDELAPALERGGGLLALQDRVELERIAAELVLEYAPGEEELARSLLLPLDR